MDDFSSPRHPLAAPLSHRPHHFFLARQPILNRARKLVAYELLFRSTASGPANVQNDIAATAAVIAHAAELGLNNVIGAMRGFINVDAEVLNSDFIHFLPQDKVVLEILETVEVDAALIARVRELRQAGFAFALDDVVAASANVEALLPHVQVIKLDLCGVPAGQLEGLSGRFRAAGKKLLAEKVESATQYERCLALGFDYFQGYHFARPSVLQGRRLSPSQLAVKQLLGLIRGQAAEPDIEQAIKRDPSIGLTLVRLAGRMGPHLQPGFDSISHALRQVDRRDLQRWLQILLYAEPNGGGEGATPLLAMAAARGRLLELLARHLRPGDSNAGEIAFTVGMLSCADALFGQPMSEVLAELPVGDDVRLALTRRHGWYGELLSLAEQVEREEEDGQDAARTMERLGLSNGDFYRLQLQAFEWGDAVAAGAAAKE